MSKDILNLISIYWPSVALVINLILAASITFHAVLNKRDTKAIITWVGLAWLAPFLGAMAYLILGINRVQRKGDAMDLRESWHGRQELALSYKEEQLRSDFIGLYPQFIGQAQLVRNLSALPVMPGNSVGILQNGDEAYPAMLSAINEAKCSIALLSYIFDSDRVGEKFFTALCEAVKRGVEVRVLIDDVGARYSKKNMVKRLRKAGVHAAAFLPTRTPFLLGYANLRNHRKILVVDGKKAFTGGTNIREDHCLECEPKFPVSCLHFQFDGPVVAHLQEAFAIDWAFTTGESLLGNSWFPELERYGKIWCRGVSHGPDEDFEKNTYTMIGALAAAKERICIVTPYFIPDSSLIYMLQTAAMKGVSVDIILPSINNIRLVAWASEAYFKMLIEKGCRIYQTPRPFDHTKLMVVDNVWSFMGSTNWDPRSLLLNFEFNVECYDEILAEQLMALVDIKIALAREVVMTDVSSWTLLHKLRNGLARLFSPYL